MGFRELVKRVQDYSGFSDKEAERSLMLFVECIGNRLTPEERKNLAAQLPPELHDVAMAGSDSSEKMSGEQFIQQFRAAQNIDEGRARKQMMATWRALKDAVSPGEIVDLRIHLPNDLVAQLH